MQTILAIVIVALIMSLIANALLANSVKYYKKRYGFANASEGCYLRRIGELEAAANETRKQLRELEMLSKNQELGFAVQRHALVNLEEILKFYREIHAEGEKGVDILDRKYWQERCERLMDTMTLKCQELVRERAARDAAENQLATVQTELRKTKNKLDYQHEFEELRCSAPGPFSQITDDRYEPPIANDLNLGDREDDSLSVAADNLS